MSAEEPLLPPSEPPPSSHRIEDILLERLKNEPPAAPQVKTLMLLSIIGGVIAVGIAIFFLSSKPDKFAVSPHQPQQEKSSEDSAQVYAKRMKFQPYIDSLTGVIAVNPSADMAHLDLANVFYETEDWQKAQTEYEIYLAKHEEDVDARVDHAYVIAQTTGDFKAAVAEIDKALEYDPEHVNALFNGGIMSIRANLDDKKKAAEDASKYFTRALAAAKKQGNEKMAEQIGKVMAELEKLKSAAK
ncbi:MAG: hypothetical protein ABI778_07695 [Ignavibacteriota bacterium]